METSSLACGGAANRHLSLLDKVQARTVRLIRDSGAVQEPTLHSLQHRRDVAGLTVMFKVQQRVSHLQALRHPVRRAEVTTKAVAQGPRELLQPRCRTKHHQRQFGHRYVGWWNALLAAHNDVNLSNLTLQAFKELNL